MKKRVNINFISVIAKLFIYPMILILTSNAFNTASFIFGVSKETFDKIAVSNNPVVFYGNGGNIDISVLSLINQENMNFKGFYNWDFLVMTAMAIMLIYSLILMLKLIKNVKNGKVFTTLNCLILKKISICFLIYSFYPTQQRMSTITLSKLANLPLPYNLQLNLTSISIGMLSIESGMLLLALCVYILTKICEYGISLQEEVDLTV